MSEQTKNILSVEEQKKRHIDPILVGGALIGVGISLTAVEPANAQSDPVADITSMVSSLGTITGSVVGIVVGAMTLRLAVKQVNRLMTKG